MKPKLILPKPDLTGKFAHAQDTFRELGELWHEHELVERIYSDIQVHPHLKIDDELICLFDRPIFEEWSTGINTDKVLFGNPTPPGKFKHESSWIFWGRRPKSLEDAREGLLTYKERTIETFFAGKIENPLQNQKRTQSQVNWSEYIEDFSCPVNGERKYTQIEYLEKIKQSKYGLCLPGYGNKCNREIELLGLGTVPIITQGVDVTHYAEPLIENVHYIYAKNGDDLRQKIFGMTEIEWIRMSQNGLEWYERNCSPQGSFDTTMKIIEKMMNNTPESFATLATDTAQADLELLYFSLRRIYPQHDLYVVCDEKIAEWAKSKEDFHLHTNTALTKYAGQNRAQMESAGVWTDFMLEKCTAIDDALAQHENTLFLDSDQCILQKIEVNTEKDLGLSQHLVYQSNEDQFGKYNGGMVFVNTPDFTKWWRLNTPNSKYMEQGILEQAVDDFDVFEFEPQVNFGWWRLLECDDKDERLKKFSYDNCLKYDGKPVVTLHTHFFEEENRTVSQQYAKVFNDFIFKMMPEDDEVISFIRKDRKGSLILMQSYYNDKNKKRQEELEYCLKQNCSNPSVEKVILFLDHDKVTYPEHEKIEVFINTEGQLTYEKAFLYAKKFYENRLCVLTNNDVFLDHESFSNTTEIENLCNYNVVLSLSRHEYNVHTQIGEMDPSFRGMLYAHTQDTWVWKANFVPEDCNFNLGTLGCDNAINDRIHRAGKVPLNLGTKYKVYHVDHVRGKKGNNKFTRDESGKIKAKDEFHNFERETFPEEKGQFLTPDYGMIQNISLDEFAKQLKFNHIEKYELYCEMMGKKIKIQNR